jgi:hypothetical protein
MLSPPHPPSIRVSLGSAHVSSFSQYLQEASRKIPFKPGAHHYVPADVFIIKPIFQDLQLCCFNSNHRGARWKILSF